VRGEPAVLWEQRLAAPFESTRSQAETPSLPVLDVSAWTTLVAAIRADHQTIARYSRKYRGAGRASRSPFVDYLRKIGFQMTCTYRVMQFARAVRIPLVPEILSRLIRHLYGADIHWNAQFEPGVMIIHGTGMCISHGTVVGSGVILFQGVTLGEGVDPLTRQIGSPRIERDVHIGPGATLIGPIVIGAESKIMAGCVVTRSVAPGSIVEACSPNIRSRRTSSMEAGR